MSKAQVTTFKRSSGFVWSMLGSAIGFANILSFSAQCYKHGGGAFLIPFTLAILVLGFPMLLLEGTIGHKMRMPLVTAFGRAAGSWGKMFGWLAVVSVATIGMFYIVLTGYSIAYAYFSAAGSISADTGLFFKQTFLRDSGSLATLGHFSVPIFVSTTMVCLASWYVLSRNIRSGVEKVCSISLPLLFGLITLFALIVCFLPGASIGFQNYLAPRWEHLANAALWRDVFGHVFFSFSLGLGIVTGYSRHTKTQTSIPRAMFFVAVGDFLISVLAGFAIFGCVGYLSHTTGTPFSEIVVSDSTFEMGFVIFPKILQAFGMLAPIIGVIFFLCVFIAGITGVFSIMESVMGNIQFEFNRSRFAAAGITTLVLFLGATLFCFGNGQHIIGALAPMVLGKNMLLGGLAQVAVFMFVAKETRDDPMWRQMRGSYLTLRYAVPMILAIILAASLSAEYKNGLGLVEVVSWVWLGLALIASVALSRKPTAKFAIA